MDREPENFSYIAGLKEISHVLGIEMSCIVRPLHSSYKSPIYAEEREFLNLVKEQNGSVNPHVASVLGEIFSTHFSPIKKRKYKARRDKSRSSSNDLKKKGIPVLRVREKSISEKLSSKLTIQLTEKNFKKAKTVFNYHCSPLSKQNCRGIELVPDSVKKEKIIKETENIERTPSSKFIVGTPVSKKIESPLNTFIGRRLSFSPIAPIIYSTPKSSKKKRSLKIEPNENSPIDLIKKNLSFSPETEKNSRVFDDFEMEYNEAYGIE